VLLSGRGADVFAGLDSLRLKNLDSQRPTRSRRGGFFDFCAQLHNHRKTRKRGAPIVPPPHMKEGTNESCSGKPDSPHP
jgi:hypothetical protein